MYCTNCGARVGDVNFCQRCGAPVKRNQDNSGDDRYNDEDRRSSDRRSSASESSGRSRGKIDDYVRDPRRTQDLLSSALSKASARRNSGGMLDEIWDYLQVAARLVQASVSGEYDGLSRKRLALIIGAIIYYVSPIDLIPDFIPIAGLLDDVGVLAFALRSLKEELEAFKQWEIGRGRGRPAA